MITKYTSIKRVIAKVLTDLDLKEEPKRISDLIEWSGEALEKIGAFPYFVNKVTGREGEPLTVISDYQAVLPMGCHRVTQIGYSKFNNGPFYPMRYGTGTFDFSPMKNSTEDSTNTILATNDLVSVAMSLYNLSYEDALTKLNSEPETSNLIQGMLTRDAGSREKTEGGEVNTFDYTYVLTGGYVKTNVKTGYLMIAYQAIPLDIDGFPLVPDDQSFIEALYWYCVMKMYYPEWKAGRMRDEVYYDSRRSWNFYCKQAYGNALMPNADELESIKNSWLRLIPKINEHDTFFTTLGEKQIIHNQSQINYHPNYAQIR
jgi:hypothetical protein